MGATIGGTRAGTFLTQISGLLIFLLESVVVLAQTTAYTFIYASYVVAIKRTSIVLSAILARLFFKEEIKDRIFPILIMLF